MFFRVAIFNQNFSEVLGIIEAHAVNGHINGAKHVFNDARHVARREGGRLHVELSNGRVIRF